MAKKVKKKKTKQEKLEAFNPKAFIRATLRGTFKKTVMFGMARDIAKQEYFIPSKTGKPMRRVNFKCASCGRSFDGDEIAVDHIVPIISSDYDNFNEWLIMFVRGLFVLDENNKPSIDKLQVLCNYDDKDMDKYGNVLSCHSQKTKSEKELRKGSKND